MHQYIAYLIVVESQVKLVTAVEVGLVEWGILFVDIKSSFSFDSCDVDRRWA